MLTLLFLAVFAALLMWAALSDLTTMEIPNRISILMAGLFPLAAFICGMSWAAIGLHVFIGIVALAAAYIMFQAGLFGGGDAKVLAAASMWVGLAALPQFLLWTAIGGGVLSAVALTARAALKPAEDRPPFLNRLLQPRSGIPYAIAIAVGGLAVLPRIPLTQF